MRAPASHLPFAHLNLTRNPFGEPDLGARADLAVVDVEHLARPLRERLAARSASPLAIQLRGPPGRGKSTHLLALHARFADASFLAYEEGGWPALPDQGVGPLFLDDAHLMRRRLRERIWTRGTCVALATHHDLKHELEPHGYDVMDVVVEGTLDVAWLRRILERRIEWARRGPGPTPGVSESTIRELMRRFGTDVRSMEGELYDRIQRLTQVRDV